MTSTGRSSGPGNWTTCAPSATIVRRLFRDRHVMRVRLAEARAGDAHEARVLHRLDRGRAAVPHRLAESADELVDDGGERPLVADAALDPLRDQLLGILDVPLEVAILREAAAHGAEGRHAAVLLEALALDDDHLPRRLVRTGEHRPEHHDVRAGADRLR